MYSLNKSLVSSKGLKIQKLRFKNRNEIVKLYFCYNFNFNSNVNSSIRFGVFIKMHQARVRHERWKDFWSFDFSVLAFSNVNLEHKGPFIHKVSRSDKSGEKFE